MSVVPLIIEGSDKNVVETDQEYEEAGGLDGEVILIKNLDRKQLLSQKNTNVSYDLRVGREYRDHRDKGKKDLGEKGVIELLPGAAVIIETEELLHFPKSTFGLLIPKVSLLQKGISNTSSKVDPGYNGHLLVTVFNLGKEVIKLTRFATFCSLHVHKVLKGARPYAKDSKRIQGDAGRTRWRKLRDLLEANYVLVLVLLTIVTFFSVVLGIINFFWGKINS